MKMPEGGVLRFDSVAGITSAFGGHDVYVPHSACDHPHLNKTIVRWSEFMEDPLRHLRTLNTIVNRCFEDMDVAAERHDHDEVAVLYAAASSGEQLEWLIKRCSGLVQDNG